ncbi:MAG: hypothetical protein AAF731_07795 [Bacteroidota bacterium]
MKISKFVFPAFALFMAVAMVACSDEQEIETELTQTVLEARSDQVDKAPSLEIKQTPVAVTDVSPSSTKWVKRKADGFDDILGQLGLYYEIPAGGLSDLDYCQERFDVALHSGVSYELLTMVADLTSIERAGINLEQGKILLGGMYIGLVENGYNGAGIIDDISQINSLDAYTLSNLNATLLHAWTSDFVLNHCTDCIAADEISISDIESLIILAGQSNPMVSYNSGNDCTHGNAQIMVSPSSTKWVKKKAD